MTAEERGVLDSAMRDAFERFRDGDVYRLRWEARLGVGIAPD